MDRNVTLLYNTVMESGHRSSVGCPWSALQMPVNQLGGNVHLVSSIGSSPRVGRKTLLRNV